MMSGAVSARSATRPLRIVTVVHSHILGGIERHVAHLLRGLSERGHAVAYAGPMDSWLGEHLSALGVTTRHLPLSGMYDLRSAIALTRFCEDFGADLVHGHAQRGARYAIWAARRLRRPSVITAHSTNAWTRFDHQSLLIAVSDAVHRFLVSHGLRPQQLRRVYPGVPDISLPRSDTASGNTVAPLCIGMVARLIRDKGHDTALAALAQVCQNHDVRLLLAGSTDTPWAAELRRQTARLGLNERVEFLGERHDVPALMARMDLLLAPSRREALSLTLAEACAASLPIVGSDVGGIPEVVQHQNNGLLVPPEDVAGFADAIRCLHADADLRRRYGAAGRARYEALFTPEVMLAGTEAVYREAVEGHARAAV